VLKMQIMKDNKGQGSAELILLFGGIIIVVVVAAIYYKNYVAGLGGNISQGQDMQNVNNNLTVLKNKFNGS
jgi:uncharacterized protein (UPF0333 family)